MMVAVILAMLFSGALLAVLGTRDPKRLRNLAHAGSVSGAKRVLPVSIRRACGWLTLAPGLVLLSIGQWWAFLMWLGATCALGWVTSHLLAGARSHS